MAVLFRSQQIFLVFLPEILELTLPALTQQSMVSKGGSGTLAALPSNTRERNSKVGAADWAGNFLIAKDFKRNREKRGENYRKTMEVEITA